MQKEFKLTITDEEDVDERLDKYIADNVSADLSRTYIQKLIKQGAILVNSSIKKSSYLLSFSDEVLINIPEPVEYHVEASNIPLDIVYEDENLLVINKNVGMVVHPACGHMDNKTLVSALLYHCKNLSGINGVLRPGIVHRLDKDTSGLMLVAKDDITHRGLSEQLENRTLKRVYNTICCGQFKENELRFESFIGRDPRNRKLMRVLKSGGKNAISNFKALQRYNHYTLMEVRLETGRTHQIRVHLKHLGYPVLGDTVYGKAKSIRLDNIVLPIKRQALHAKEIKFIHPVTKKELEFKTELPEDILKVLEILEEKDL
jgi:23S rRNA pseudouridine1911/1915/1917 synthase